MSDPLSTARAAWGEDIPLWVEALAEACAASSQNRVAEKLGRSAALVSQVLRNVYPGSLDAVEEVVSGALMGSTVACPVLGELSQDRCQAWRKRSRHFQNTNAQSVLMYRACNRCPVKLRQEEPK